MKKIQKWPIAHECSISLFIRQKQIKTTKRNTTYTQTHTHTLE